MDVVAVKVVKLRLRGTHAAVRRLDRQVSNGAKDSLREAAMFGLTAVERQISRTQPRPVASGSYRSGWVVKHTKRGAVLGNSTAQAVQVEVGRDPGSPPPIDPLREWVLLKRIVKPVRQRAPKALKSGDVVKYDQKNDERRRARAHKSFLRRSAARSAQARAIAAKIAKAIGRRGVPGKFVLAKSLPRTQRFLHRQLRKNTREALLKHRG